MKLPLARLLSAVIVGSISRAISAQPDMARVEIEARHITNTVYMLVGVGGVVGYMAMPIGPDGALLVDSGYEQLADNTVAAIRRIGSAPSDLSSTRIPTRTTSAQTRPLPRKARP